MTCPDPSTQVCADERRRARARASGINGIDVVDVARATATAGELLVILFGRAPDGLTAANFRIDGGHQVTGITGDRRATVRRRGAPVRRPAW